MSCNCIECVGWANEQAEQIGTRACALCIYRSGADTCWHPRVTIGAGPKLIIEARAVDGACGIEAIYLSVPGWTEQELAGVRRRDQHA